MLKRVIIVAVGLAALGGLAVWLLRPQPVSHEAENPAATMKPARPGKLTLPDAPPRKADIEPGTSGAAIGQPRGEPEIRIVDGIEMVRGETLDGEEIWIPTAPAPPMEQELDVRPADEEEFLPGPEP